jgi:hypothetical protein
MVMVVLLLMPRFSQVMINDKKKRRRKRKRKKEEREEREEMERDIFGKDPL